MDDCGSCTTHLLFSSELSFLEYLVGKTGGMSRDSTDIRLAAQLPKKFSKKMEEQNKPKHIIIPLFLMLLKGKKQKHQKDMCFRQAKLKLSFYHWNK